jgi:hypothetical protein
MVTLVPKVEPDLVSFLESRGIGQTVVAGLHPVIGHLQMLTGVMMDAGPE